MLILRLKDFIQYDTFRDIYAVTWQLAYDENFKYIFVNDYKDNVNIYSVNIPVPFDILRDYNKKIYARVKLYYKADNDRLIETDWYVLKENREDTERLPLKYNGFTIGYIERDENSYRVVSLIKIKR